MLPIIGFIVATYTIFRFIETLEKPIGVFEKLPAALAFLITLFLCWALWTAGANTPSYPH